MVRLDIPKPLNSILSLHSTTFYIEATWTGLQTDDIIKVEYSTDNETSYVSAYQFTTGAILGTKKSVVGPIKPHTTHIRVKGYDSDGATALTDEESKYKAAFLANTKKTMADKERDISLDLERVANDSQASDLSVTLPKGSLRAKELWRYAIDEAYRAIEAADGNQTDITRVALSGITWNSTTRATYGTEKYPKGIRRGIEAKKSKWVINGAHMSVPHWISNDYIYTFATAAKAKKCENVLMLKGSKNLLLEARKNYSVGNQKYTQLTAGITTIDSITTEKITEI